MHDDKHCNAINKAISSEIEERDQDATLALLSISNYVALSPVHSQNIEGVIRRTLHSLHIAPLQGTKVTNAICLKIIKTCIYDYDL